jgi:hypothetical protein
MGGLLLSLFFGLVGTAYFIYGKKQQNYIWLFTGIGLGVYPYFVSNLYVLLLIGAALMAVPFYIND